MYFLRNNIIKEHVFYWTKATALFLNLTISEACQNTFVKNDEHSLMNQSEEEIMHFILAMIFWTLKQKKKRWNELHRYLITVFIKLLFLYLTSYTEKSPPESLFWKPNEMHYAIWFFTWYAGIIPCAIQAKWRIQLKVPFVTIWCLWLKNCKIFLFDIFFFTKEVYCNSFSSLSS